MKSLMSLAMVLSLVSWAIADDPPQTVQTPPSKTLPVPGDVFWVEGRPEFLILPESRTRDDITPWVWYAPTMDGLPGLEERWMFEHFLKAGIAIAGIDVGNSHGSPDGRKLYTSLYRVLTETRGMAAKPVLLGRSRGGLMTLGWAVDNPHHVGGFAGIYPVCNLASWPGLAEAAGPWGLSEHELAAQLANHNPLDRVAPLARAKVPLFSIHGDSDTVVPLESNSGEMYKRYRDLGGEMQLVISKGQGHTMWSGFFQNQALVDFVIKNAKSK